MCVERAQPPRGHCRPPPPCGPPLGAGGFGLLPLPAHLSPAPPTEQLELPPAGPFPGLNCAPESYVEVLTLSASQGH